jgi:Cu/Ag efflux protein CusF
MRLFATLAVAAAVAFSMLATAPAALADDANGKIEKVNIDAGTIELDDGKTYKLPGEFDPEQLKTGNEIFLVFQVVDGENIITDMEVTEAEGG